ncbi:ATP-binding domain-containing protein, partial [bacterium]|nr:ATP-binding domain-containing protein [bacterium]
NHITVFADPQQQIFKEGASELFILKALNLNKRNATLLEAYRNAPYVARLASFFIADKDMKRQYLSQVCTEQKIRELPLCFVAPSFEKEMDRLVDIIRQRQVMNERVGIIVPMNKQLHGMAKMLEERGIVVEKAIGRDSNGKKAASCDFGNSTPKIATYHMAKGLTFDSVILPRLVESSFPWLHGTARQRLIFVGIARSTQWVYLSTVKGEEILEFDILREAAKAGQASMQYKSDLLGGNRWAKKNQEIDDNFSVL